MSFRDNLDLRIRAEGGTSFVEHELYTVFNPLIGPMGMAVYCAFTRLVPLVISHPDEYKVTVRSISEYACVSRTIAAEQMKQIYALGMVVETKYLDGRDPSYKLMPLQEVAKYGDVELKRRIGLGPNDRPPFDQKHKNRLEKAMRRERRRNGVGKDNVLPLLDHTDVSYPPVHYPEQASEGAQPQGAHVPGSAAPQKAEDVRPADPRVEASTSDCKVDGVRHTDTVHIAEDANGVRQTDAMCPPQGHGVRHTDTADAQRSRSLNLLTHNLKTPPLPPAERGDVSPDGSSLAIPSLPHGDCSFDDPAFELRLPTAARWVKAELCISARRIDGSIAEQLRMHCRRHRDVTLQAAAALMAQQGRKLHEDAHLLRHHVWGWPSFINGGHWARPLPYDTRLTAHGAMVGTRVSQADTVEPTDDNAWEKLPPAPEGNAWSQIRNEIKPKINPNSFDTWLKPIRFSHVDGRVLYVRIPSAEYSHIGDRYHEQIREAIGALQLDVDDVVFLKP